MTRSLRIMVAAGLVLVVALGVVGALVLIDDDETAPSAPPLGEDYPDAEYCIEARPGQGLSYGATSLGNDTREPVTLISARLDGVSGVKLLGVQVVPERIRPNGVHEAPGVIRRYPLGSQWSKRHAVEVEGAEIDPGTTYFLLFGLELEEVDGGSKRVIVDYEWAGDEYSAVIPHAYRAGTCRD